MPPTATSPCTNAKGLLVRLLLKVIEWKRYMQQLRTTTMSKSIQKVYSVLYIKNVDVYHMRYQFLSIILEVLFEPLCM